MAAVLGDVKLNSLALARVRTRGRSPDGCETAALAADESADCVQVVVTRYLHQGDEIFIGYGPVSTCDFALR
jgi:hypothetical protein